MNIAKGTLLGPYEIVDHLGSGGMGEVWRARDRRIGRDVAIKVLPQFAAGDERVRRFEQEARAAGALSHPGLVTIYDVGTVDGAPYIVMELLHGETLREALGDDAPKALPLKKAIDYAVQAASALAAAHEKGIIHRDLKPENIFITPDHRVKILDFGLAKLAQDANDDRDRTGGHLTSTGMVVGTPGYMSPEQVRARPLDHCTDIFALGSVIYEMLSGRRAFDRDSAVETMTAVLNEEPEALSTLGVKLPTALDAIVRHCMEKNPRERFQSARDLAFQLRLLPDYQNSVTDRFKAIAHAPESRNRFFYRAGIAVLSVLGLAGAGFALLRSRAEPRQPFAAFKQLTFNDGLTMSPSLSPDGKMLAYVSSQAGKRDIYVQRVDGRMATNLTADSGADDSEPAFSPDGAQIAFRSEREGGGIFVMSVTGESPHRLTDFGHDPSWSPDGKRIAVGTQAVGLRPQVHMRQSELWIIDATTGASRALLRLADRRDSDGLQPNWSPDGKHIAFFGVSERYGRPDIWTIDPNAQHPLQTIVRVTTDPALHWNPVWSPDGKTLYFGSNRNGSLNLWRVPMDASTGKPAGAPEPVTLPASMSGTFSFSRQGTLAYGTVTRTYRLLAFPVDHRTWQLGAPRPLFASSQEISTFDASPDQRLIAFTNAGEQEDLFIAQPDGTHLRQVTNDAARDRGVAWSPDGKTLYMYSERDGGYQIWSIRSDGSGLARVTDETALKAARISAVYSPSPGPDGETIAAGTPEGTVLIHLDRPMPQRVEPTGVRLGSPEWSPDGKQLIGVHRPGIGIYSVPTHRFAQISDRGIDPFWLGDDQHVLFFDRGAPNVLDLRTGGVTTSAIKLPGASWDDPAVPRHVSRDGSTLYVRQMLEQGDVWLAHF